MKANMKDNVKKNNSTKKIIALMLAFLMLVTLIPSDLRLRAADENEINTEELVGNTGEAYGTEADEYEEIMTMLTSDDDLVDVYTEPLLYASGSTQGLLDGTSVTLKDMTFTATYRDETGNWQTKTLEQNDKIELPADATVDLMLNFQLADGNRISAGTEYTYQIPEGIRVDVNETLPLQIAGQGSIGTVAISRDGTLTFVFDKDVIGDSKYVDFYVGFGGGLSDDFKNAEHEEKISFPAGGATFDFTIDSLGETTPNHEDDGTTVGVNKSGNIIKGSDGKTYVEWKAELVHRNGNTDPIEGNIIDTLPAGLKYVSGNVNGAAYPRIDGGNNYSFNQQYGAPKIVDNTNGNNVNIKVENCNPDYSVAVVFLTEVDGSLYGSTINDSTQTTINNSLVFNPSDGSQGITSDTAVTKRPDVLSKSRSGVNGNGEVTWTVVVNEDRLNIGGATVTDTFTNGSYVAGSLSAKYADGSPVEGVTVNGDTIEWTAPAGCSKKVIIEYKTTITDFQTESKNTVKLQGGTDLTYDVTRVETVPGATVIDKWSSGYDPLSQYITWTIRVNQDGRTLDNVVVSDIFDGKYMEFVSASGATVASEETLPTGVNYNGQTFEEPYKLTFNLGNITTQKDITVVTKVKTDVVSDTWWNFANYSRVTFGDGTKSDDDLATQTAHVTKVDLGSKSGEFTKKNGTQNGDGTITWTIIINEQKQLPNKITIKDVLPNNMDFVPGSLRLDERWYDSDHAQQINVEVKTSDQAGLACDPYIEFDITPEANGQFLKENNAFKIVYKTKIKENAALTEVTTPQNYQNNATITAKFPGNITVEETESATVTGTAGGVLGKDYLYKSGEREVTWIVKINEARLDMSAVRNPVIKDKLENYFEYVPGSGSLYRVKADGTREAIPAGNYSVAAVNNVVTVALPNIATNYYEFEFKSRIPNRITADQLKNIKVNNSVELEGEGTLLHTQSSDISNISFSSSVAGAIINRQIRVKKIDKTTGAVLKGAVFELYLPGTDGHADLYVGEATTGDDGYAVFNGCDELLGHKVKIKEVEKPAGYEYSDDSSHSGYTTVDGVTEINNLSEENLISDEFGKYYEVIIPNSTEPEPTATIKIKKVDEDDATKVIPDAWYGLYTDVACTVLYTGTTTKATDEEGYVSFNNINTEGTYYIKETVSPAGYKLNPNKVTVVVTKNADDTFSVTYDGIAGDYGTVSDKKAKGSFTINKAKRGTISTPVPGVTFTLYKDEACTLEVDSKQTDVDGKVVFDNLELGKTYWYREESAPNEYVLD